MKSLIRKYIPLDTRLQFHQVRKYFYLLNPKKLPKQRFIIYGSGRSGSTLLTSLLNSHPDVFCDGEVLSEKVIRRLHFPLPYIRAISKRASLNGKSTYGCGLMSYQLENHLNINHCQFIKDLVLSGWRIIHIRRNNILNVILSILTAQQDNVWELRNSVTYNESRIYVNKKDLLFYINIHKFLHKTEDEILKEVSHYKVVYENDLESGQWQFVMNNIFNFLELPPKQVSSNLKKKSNKDIADRITNYAEIEPILIENHLI